MKQNTEEEQHFLQCKPHGISSSISTLEFQIVQIDHQEIFVTFLPIAIGLACLVGDIQFNI